MNTLDHIDEPALYQLMDQHQLIYYLHQHQPVFTVEEGRDISLIIPGAHSKNLFLKNKKGHFFLVSVLEDKRVNLKQLSQDLGKGGLSFASALELFNLLHLAPGSVTPLGLISPDAKGIEFILDEDFLKYDYVNFHPLRNDKTIQIPKDDFLKFFEIICHTPVIRSIPVL